MLDRVASHAPDAGAIAAVVQGRHGDPFAVLGPHEDLGRLPDYLRRAAHGEFVVGGSPDREFQYVDVRDLAEFILLCAETGRPGAFDVVTDPGAYTWGDLAGSVAAATGGTPVFVDDQRLLAATLDITPNPSELRWMHDVFGNSVAFAQFAGRARELRFESRFRLDHRPLAATDVRPE